MERILLCGVFLLLAGLVGMRLASSVWESAFMAGVCGLGVLVTYFAWKSDWLSILKALRIWVGYTAALFILRLCVLAFKVLRRY